MDNIERLRSIKSFPSLVKYLRDELDWPIEADDFDDLYFDYEPEELGIDAKTAAKIKDIKQLRPLASHQPWGVFFINFEPKQLPIVALRRILRAIVIKKRASANKSQQAVWQLHDLLFISAYGQSDGRELSFAHFAEDEATGDLPVLKVLGWDEHNTVLRLEDTHRTLKEKLYWPQDEADLEGWRKSWSSAFTVGYSYSVRTSKELSIELARLATVIRARANEVLAVESERGQMRQLYQAFQEALIHDLSEDDFADMYAQTIAYGLLSARVSRESGALVADNLADMVPVTNPFLKELMQTFLTVGGRKNKIDFDELGVNEVVELLRQANMESVLKDFGDRNPSEDPVIHFYELFLKEYDPQKRTKRGVFYTPKPVVSFIVRSVDEILRTEFGLADGLADTTTWAEFIEQNKIRHPLSEIRIPAGVAPTAPFVQILDPATGTGTFLVEVIDVIYRTLRDKWSRADKSETEMRRLWNEYVPRHLLPRLHGFELMMAPYAIAHMKIGLKLAETKYAFLSSERARIYLTNTLEVPKDFSDYFEQMAPALAHEAQAANKVKRSAPITIVIGNPPYSGHSSNVGQWINDLLRGKDRMTGAKAGNYFEVDGQPLGERNPKWLNDDYVKFIRYAHWRVEETGTGVLAFITNHGYLDNPTFRGMRQSLMQTFDDIYLLNLHGNSKKKERSPDGAPDENVFEIQQGVATCLMAAIPRPQTALRAIAELHYAHLWGMREVKYGWLLKNTASSTEWSSPQPGSPFYLFAQQNFNLREEYEIGWKLGQVFPVNSVGTTTGRDQLCVSFDREEALKKVNEFSSRVSENTLIERYGLSNKSGWSIDAARQAIRREGISKTKLLPYLYRPFDIRLIYFDQAIVGRTRLEVMAEMTAGPNLGLCTNRQVNGDFRHALCTREVINDCATSTATRERTYLFPLYMQSEYANSSLFARSSGKSSNDCHPNITHEFASSIESHLHIRPKPEDIFHYCYAALHSPAYRTRYAEFLKIDFPRIPLTSDVELFRQLCAKGADLVALHLLEDDYEAASWNRDDGGGMKDEKRNPLAHPITRFVCGGAAEVAKGHPKYTDGNVFINPTCRFEGVPAEVWNFHIGGYQVCEKWLKDRRGRTLTAADIAHYQRVVVALKETIRLMREIDEVIEAHGGWPLVGSQNARSQNLPDGSAPNAEPEAPQQESLLPFV